MDELEGRMKTTPLREPSERLDARMAALREAHWTEGEARGPRFSFASMAATATCALALGFLAGFGSGRNSTDDGGTREGTSAGAEARATQRVEIVLTRSPIDRPFLFTTDSTPFFAERVKTEIRQLGGEL